MPDWHAIVRRRLSGLALDADEKEEVQAELAAHLEESYEVLLREGVSKPDAIRRALSLAGDWQDLRQRIQMARREGNNMTNRVKQLWLPGFLTLLLSMGLLMLIQLYGPSPWTVARKSGWSFIPPVAVVYYPWLLALPLIGAMGSYLSSRAGASQRLVLLSILFPVLPYLILFLIAVPVALVLDEHVAHNIMFAAFLVGLFAWVLLPGAALLAGGLPARLFLSRRLASRRALSN